MASSSTPATVAYEPNNGGAGGKFRKKPFRKPPTTPYDRPLTAFRPIQNTNNNDNDGWLSKIVNPASKIITSGAHKIFASVFRKGLLPPPSSPPLRRTSVEAIRVLVILDFDKPEVYFKVLKLSHVDNQIYIEGKTLH